jgi:hypothetical protein
MTVEATGRLQTAALDGAFAEWVRSAVRRFVMDYDFLDAALHREVIRKYENVYDGFVAMHFHTDDGPIWVGHSSDEVEQALRADFRLTNSFREAATWSKDGSRCLSCGTDLTGTQIDLQTLTEDTRRTLTALYLMSLGDSVLLTSKNPDGNEWRDCDDEIQGRVAQIVSEIALPPHDRFGRIGLVIERVLYEWCEVNSDINADHIVRVGDSGNVEQAEAMKAEAIVETTASPALSLDEELAQSLTKSQWLVLQYLRKSSNRVRFSTLKRIPGCFRKGEESSDRAVTSLIERANERLADAGLEVKHKDSQDGEYWAWLVDLKGPE